MANLRKKTKPTPVPAPAAQDSPHGEAAERAGQTDFVRAEQQRLAQEHGHGTYEVGGQ